MSAPIDLPGPIAVAVAGPRKSAVAILQAHCGLVVVGYVIEDVTPTEVKVDIARVVAAKFEAGELVLGEHITPTDDEAVSIRKAIAAGEFQARGLIPTELIPPVVTP